jgi:hypothetical protein
LRDDAFASTAFDANGIIQIRYRYRGLGLQYSPVRVAQYALSSYNVCQEAHGREYLEAFVRHARWLVTAFSERGEWGVWPFRYDFSSPGYRCRAPWVSAMAQGLGVSTLIRYHSLFGEGNVLEIARKALGAYDVPIAEGGVLRIDESGLRWYEEYACPGSGTPLNGFVFSLVGAKEWYDYTGDVKGQRIFRRGIDTLERRIGDFELALPFLRWTRYDNRFVIHAGRRYHDLHIRQLKVLEELYEGEDGAFLRKRHETWRAWEQTYGTSLLFAPYEILCRGYARLMKGLRE